MTAATALEPFVGVKTILLTTYRRDGTRVATPVSIAVGEDRAFFRTFDKAWKAKRLRRNANVEIAPDWSGHPCPGPPARRRRGKAGGANACSHTPALAGSACPARASPDALPDAALRVDAGPRLAPASHGGESTDSAL